MTFSDPDIIQMLKEDFVPAAIDQFFQRKQRDAEGEFYRKVAKQGPRSNFNSTTQGRYVCTPDGKLLGFNNNRGPDRIKKIMRKALAEFDSTSLESVNPIDPGTPDPKFNYAKPTNGLILRVNAKILGGYKPTDKWTSIFHDVISRDNVWFRTDESRLLNQSVLAGGEVPRKITERIARFHLVDNTRGEPPRWRRDEIKSLSLRIDRRGVLAGEVHLETKDGKRGYIAQLRGVAQSDGDRVTRFDLVAKGLFWGHGRYTYHPPGGKFPLAIAFRIVDNSDPSNAAIPHGMKGWAAGYFE